MYDGDPADRQFGLFAFNRCQDHVTRIAVGVDEGQHGWTIELFQAAPGAALAETGVSIRFRLAAAAFRVTSITSRTTDRSTPVLHITASPWTVLVRNRARARGLDPWSSSSTGSGPNPSS